MEKEKKLTEKEIGFVQGYALAVVTMIYFEGGVDTPIRELWEALGVKIRNLRKYRLDEGDLEVLRKYRKELEPVRNC